MSNLKEIKRKIKSVHNTQKTTNAMKLVSTAKLKKAEEAAKRARVYAQKIDEILSEISYQLNKVIHNEEDTRFSLFHERKQIKNIDLIFITADKGLCGGFNIKTLKAVSEFLSDYKNKNINIRVVDIFSIKPIDKELIIKCAKETKRIITVEDHSVIGGLGSSICEVLSESYPVKVERMGIEDTFGKSGKAEELLKYFKIDKDAIIEKLLS